MNFIRSNILPLALGLIGLVLILFGLAQLLLKPESNAPLAAEQTDTSQTTVQVMVDVEGAVINPGVYRLPFDARIVDALAAAGGMSEEADRVLVQKTMNLAQKISDGLKIYVPREGEQVLSGSAGNSGPVININLASESELNSLPGIGQITAAKIIEGRPYAQIEDLTAKKIVGAKVFDQIKHKISAN